MQAAVLVSLLLHVWLAVQMGGLFLAMVPENRIEEIQPEPQQDRQPVPEFFFPRTEQRPPMPHEEPVETTAVRETEHQLSRQENVSQPAAAQQPIQPDPLPATRVPPEVAAQRQTQPSAPRRSEQPSLLSRNEFSVPMPAATPIEPRDSQAPPESNVEVAHASQQPARRQDTSTVPAVASATPPIVPHVTPPLTTPTRATAEDQRPTIEPNRRIVQIERAEQRMVPDDAEMPAVAAAKTPRVEIESPAQPIRRQVTENTLTSSVVEPPDANASSVAVIEPIRQSRNETVPNPVRPQSQPSRSQSFDESASVQIAESMRLPAESPVQSGVPEIEPTATEARRQTAEQVAVTTTSSQAPDLQPSATVADVPAQQLSPAAPSVPENAQNSVARSSSGEPRMVAEAESVELAAQETFSKGQSEVAAAAGKIAKKDGSAPTPQTVAANVPIERSDRPTVASGLLSESRVTESQPNLTTGTDSSPSRAATGVDLPRIAEVSLPAATDSVAEAAQLPQAADTALSVAKAELSSRGPARQTASTANLGDGPMSRPQLQIAGQPSTAAQTSSSAPSIDASGTQSIIRSNDSPATAESLVDITSLPNPENPASNIAPTPEVPNLAKNQNVQDVVGSSRSGQVNVNATSNDSPKLGDMTVARRNESESPTMEANAFALTPRQSNGVSIANATAVEELPDISPSSEIGPRIQPSASVEQVARQAARPSRQASIDQPQVENSASSPSTAVARTARAGTNASAPQVASVTNPSQVRRQNTVTATLSPSDLDISSLMATAPGSRQNDPSISDAVGSIAPTDRVMTSTSGSKAIATIPDVESTSSTNIAGEPIVRTVESPASARSQTGTISRRESPELVSVDARAEDLPTSAAATGRNGGATSGDDAPVLVLADALPLQRYASGVTSRVAAPEGPGGIGPQVSAATGLPSRFARRDAMEVSPVTSRFLQRETAAVEVDTRVRDASPAFAGRERSRHSSQGTVGPQTERAIELGLAFLARHQSPDGSWSLQGFGQGQTGYEQESSIIESTTAATGLALLSYLGAGYDHYEDKYQSNVDQALRFLVNQQRRNGDLYIPEDAESNQFARLYSHGIATLALCEAYGMTGDDWLREPAQRAIDFVVASQHAELGGWRYVPGKESDTSVTGWMMMALKSAELARLEVPSSVFRLAEHWLDLAQDGNEASLYVYNPYAEDVPSRRHGREPSDTMTAVGLLLRLYLGWDRHDEAIIAGAENLKQNLPSLGSQRRPLRDTYYWYYATQVMFHMSSEYWQAWNDSLHPLLIDHQVQQGRFAGSWDPLSPIPDRWGYHGGRIYVTTMNLLSLEVYYRHLPLYDSTAK